MHFRFVVSKMCLDIEHVLKVRIIHDVEIDTSSDGYYEVYNFLNKNQNIISSIEKKITSPFTGNLIHKYFTVKVSVDSSTGKTINEIVAYDDCPVWVLVELLFYGRMVEKKSYFADNTLIKNSYSFACIMIENLVK